MFFDEKGNLIVHQDNDGGSYIPRRNCAMIYQNMCKGKRWWEASPVYQISREEAAYIFTNFSSVLKKEGKEEKEKKRENKI